MTGMSASMVFRLEARDGIYWALFIRSLGMAAVNAWILHELLHGSSAMDQKEFCRHVVVRISMST